MTLFSYCDTIFPTCPQCAGSLNLDVCSSEDIPLYLLIAGCCLSIEVIVHTFTIMISFSTDNEATNRFLRMCDCFAFFTLVWFIIASNWIFRLSFHSKPCIEESDTELSSSGLGGNDFLTTTHSFCEDCSNGVYKFAIGVTVVEYIAIFSVFIVCCCVIIKKGRD